MPAGFGTGRKSLGFEGVEYSQNATTDVRLKSTLAHSMKWPPSFQSLLASLKGWSFTPLWVYWICIIGCESTGGEDVSVAACSAVRCYLLGLECRGVLTV